MDRVVLIAFLVAFLSLFHHVSANSGDMKVEEGMCRHVFGFCQRPIAAMFSGGFYNGNTTILSDSDFNDVDFEKTCFTGIFDSNDTKSNNKSAVTLPKSWCSAPLDKHKFGCFGIAQCGRGAKCGWDYSCLINDPNSTRDFIQGNYGETKPMSFVGAFKFLDGSFGHISCNVDGVHKLSTTVHLHGIDVEIFPKELAPSGKAEKNRACPRTKPDGRPLPHYVKVFEKEPDSLYEAYDCKATALIRGRPLGANEVFSHTFTYSGERRLTVCWLVIVPILVFLAEISR